MNLEATKLQFEECLGPNTVDTAISGAQGIEIVKNRIELIKQYYLDSLMNIQSGRSNESPKEPETVLGKLLTKQNDEIPF